MNFDCWAAGTWAAGSWVIGSWCPATPIPPTPVIQIVEARRWPGPPYVLYSDEGLIPYWQRWRENEEIIIL